MNKKILLRSGRLSDVKALIVDNDQDTRELYALTLSSEGARVTTFGSIGDALEFLDRCTPSILICETRFLGESVYPLIQKVRDFAFGRLGVIPIVIASTRSLPSPSHPLLIDVEADLLKPIDVNDLIDEIWTLTRLSNRYPSSLREWASPLDIAN
jgi:DNA-binding NtrC family response regulator